MATVKFNLRGKDATKPQPIYLIFRDKGEKLTYATGFKVLPKHWNDTKGRVKNVNQVENRDEINSFLDKLEAGIKKEVARLRNESKPVTKDAVKEHLEILAGNKKPADNSFFGFVERFIEESPHRINPTTGQKIHSRTIQKYNTTFSKLKDFAEYTGKTPDFENIGLEFYQDYTAYLNQIRKHSTNTIGKEIQTIKVFLNAATDRGINQNTTFKSHRFKVVSEESEAVYLDEMELSQLAALDLSDNTRLERVRDLFLVGCWTGCRFSDVTRISPYNIKGGMIHIEQQKTGNKVAIPLHPVVKSVWEKYGQSFPNEISNQRFNEYIKEVCKLAGLTATEHKAITKGGIKRTKAHKKYELITSHTARRSFATNLYKSGFPAISIMQITGHKTEKAFLRYIKVTPQEHAKLLQAHWAKTGANLKVV